ncbi:MAG: translation elongation factor 4 [Candidatus Aureabacteria bacterium]|nr:translation elongation factor 4 [Candidatus Auribacterota bacterium]
MTSQNIRNFSVIAHIDHGKSTLADRILELTHTVSKRDIKEQTLDDMDLERERGITIKAHPVRIDYKALDGKAYTLNLIDTPGHVDFTHEVSRSLASCEGALLLIDASQGVEAQSVANVHLASEYNLEIIPVINKIDLPNADVESVKRQIEDVLQIPAGDAILTSAKTGEGVEKVLERIVSDIPPPPEPKENKLKALIFDSVYNTYRGVVLYVRVFEGGIKKGMKVLMMGKGKELEVTEVGIFRPKATSVDKLESGEVGYIISNIKIASEVVIGDTITDARSPVSEPVAGFKQIHPMVFSGVYPSNSAEYEILKDVLDKFALNDASLSYEPENSVALGFGFRCGFLGLLHMEIVQERIEREFGLDIVMTHPSVVYKVNLKGGQSSILIDNPLKLPEQDNIESIEEPYVKVYVICPASSIGSIMQICRDRRGELLQTETLDSKRVMMTFNIPMNEIIIDFHDKIKSATKGYGSMDYEFEKYKISDIGKLEILINGDPVDAFSTLVHRSKAETKGRQVIEKLKELMPRHLFQIALQATVGNRVIARTTIKAMRKDVTAKCYGGDITRKRKLLEKQKEGKKRMKQVGKISIPQKAFTAILKTD